MGKRSLLLLLASIGFFGCGSDEDIRLDPTIVTPKPPGPDAASQRDAALGPLDAGASLGASDAGASAAKDAGGRADAAAPQDGSLPMSPTDAAGAPGDGGLPTEAGSEPGPSRDSGPAPPAQGLLDLRAREKIQFQRVSGPPGERGNLGVPVAAGFDIDGDGNVDYARSSFLASGKAGYASGIVYLLMGDGADQEDIDLAQSPRNVLKIFGTAEREATGSEVWMDDVTGDGLGDLLISRQNYRASAPDRPGAGALTVIAGGQELRVILEEAAQNQLQAEIDLANLDPRLRVFTIIGSQTAGRFGMWVRSGDVTGDQITDLVVGADQESGVEGERHGALYVFRGGPHLAQNAELELSALAGTPLAGNVARVTPGPDSEGFHLGATVQVGDLDRNGRADVIGSAALVRSGASLWAAGSASGSAVSRGGAPGGRVFIAWDDNFPDEAWPAGYEFQMTAPPGDVTTILSSSTSLLTNRKLGEEVIAGEDYDGNGRPDLFIGDMTASVVGPDDGRRRTAAGAGFLLFNADALRAHSEVELHSLPDGIGLTTVLGAVSSAILGDTAQGGDFNGDGVADLLIAAPQDTAEMRFQAGVAYVLWGNTGGFPEIIDTRNLPASTEVPMTRIWGAFGGFGNDAGDMLAYSAAATDADGDSLVDLVLNEMGGNGVAGARDTGNYLVLTGAELTRNSPDCEGRLGGDARFDRCGVCNGPDVGFLEPQGCTSFEYDVQPILYGDCTRCHGAGGGLGLYDYTQLMLGQSDHGPVVLPGRGADSDMVRKMLGQTSYGDAMPPGVPMEPEKSEIIRAWIDEGARDN